LKDSRDLMQPDEPNDQTASPEYPAEKAIALGVILEKLVRSLYPSRAPGALQPLQWSMLRYFAQCSPERATIGLAARFVGLNHAPVSRTVQTLISKGLLVQQTNPEDRRGKSYRLTTEGQTTLECDPLLNLRNATSVLSVDDLEKFERNLRQITLELAMEKDAQ
jgi:DNA-binding MarR family transcriptional regulator